MGHKLLLNCLSINIKSFKNALLFFIFIGLFFNVDVWAQSLKHQNFDASWKFSRDQFAQGELLNFDDSEWQSVNLPHDWAIAGPFAEEFDANSGGLPTVGIGWYRKAFALPTSAKNKIVRIDFDGAMNNSKVWVNGHYVGGRPYGYSSFALDITPFLNKPGQKNVIAVKLDQKAESSRWYSGAGIYRHVWLNVMQPMHLAHWGTYIKTPIAEKNKATVWVQTKIDNDSPQAAKPNVQIILLNAAGKEIARKTSSLTVQPKKTGVVDMEIELNNPTLWDLDNPYLYKAVTIISDGKSIAERDTTNFGIRKIEFVASKGFLLNDKLVKLNGVCNHHDLGPLGTAVNTRAIERQLELLKAMGANAIRTSHNPPAPELIALCDKMGFLVDDEAFDAWQIGKRKNDYSLYFDEWHERDLRDMIKRDRNHPSVIMWSIGNEIPEQGTKDGWKLAKMLVDICHDEDNSRPTTEGFDNPEAAIKNNMAQQVDVKGFNYKAARYAGYAKAHPDWVIMGSETESAVSSRGIYHLPVKKENHPPSLQVSSYDVDAPGWAYLPDVEFDAQAETPAVLGSFTWTGFDYLGEPTPFGEGVKDNEGRIRSDWPSRSSYFGILDLCGIPKDRYYLYQSHWTTKPMIHLLPHWNWNETDFNGKKPEGQIIPVFVYTNCDSAELFLNGKSMGTKVKGKDLTIVPVKYNAYNGPLDYPSKYRLSWDVPYQPGEIKVVGFKNGKSSVTDERKTAGKPETIELIPDRNEIAANGDDLCYVTVEVKDKDGNVCPRAENLIWFGVTGAGKIEAVGNGNAATTLSFKENYRPLFSGEAMLIVRSKKGEKGKILINAKGEGLKEASKVIEAR